MTRRLLAFAARRSTAGSWLRVLPALTVLMLTPTGLSAQTAPLSRFSLSIGPDWVGQTGQGGENAVLTGNPRDPFPLFDAETTLTGGIGASAAVGVRVTRTLWAEATLRYHSARLESQITNDMEGGDATATAAVQQLDIQAGALWLPEAWRLGHFWWFATGGAGYLRQLHASHTLAETGRGYYAGGGLLIVLPRRPGGAFRTTGVRLEARAAATQNGVAFDDRLHLAPALWAAFYVGF